MIVIGIDPGQSGGIAWIEPAFVTPRVAGAAKMPETEHDVCEHLRDLAKRQGEPVLVVVELVTPMPKQGLGSTWKFGQHYGMLRGILAALGWRYQLVTAGKWQKALGCLTHGDKNISKAAAQRLFPELKITHATADALLLAYYATRTLDASPAGAALNTQPAHLEG
jgi:crossover junction endodeoxyribonuclease RuvC